MHRTHDQHITFSGPSPPNRGGTQRASLLCNAPFSLSTRAESGPMPQRSACWGGRDLNLWEEKMGVDSISCFPAALGSVEGHADVAERCENAVCGRSTYDGTRVKIYLYTQMNGATHFNFRTNPGAQIELRTKNYSFNMRPGRTGTYSAQACRSGGPGQRSFCTAWATFRWDSVR